MNFITDKQTTDELNLLGKYQNGSVYGIFRKTKTQIGDRLLEDMLRHPLTDKEKINKRSELFHYFQEKNIVFPFENEQVNEFAEWLSATANRSGIGSFLYAVKQKATASLLHDEGYQKQTAGLTAAYEILRKLYSFLQERFDTKDYAADSPFVERLTAIKHIFSEKNTQKFIHRSDGNVFTVKEVASYERLLKNTLSSDMQTILAFIGELDVYTAVGKTAADNNYTYAVITDDEVENELYLKNVKHPALQHAQGNDLHLNSQCNLLFLTGANMAGKSTLMKSIGIAVYLAHCGFPVAADAMRFSLKEGMLSSINVSDNVNLGYSHFYAEVLRVKEAAKAVADGKNMFVMFDELFKGTNVKDAFEGTLEVTKAFAKYRNCLFVISTHIIEVGEELEDKTNISFGYMPTIMEGNKPRYTYSLTEGITEDKQGLLIIQNEGIPQLLGIE